MGRCIAGFGIGVVAAVTGVAGGELLMPSITIWYAVAVKVDGRLTRLVSPPTMVVAFMRHSRDGDFDVLRPNPRFVTWLTVGSLAGAVLGGLLLGVVLGAVLGPVVVLLLLASARRIWRHADHEASRHD